MDPKVLIFCHFLQADLLWKQQKDFQEQAFFHLQRAGAIKDSGPYIGLDGPSKAWASLVNLASTLSYTFAL